MGSSHREVQRSKTIEKSTLLNAPCFLEISTCVCHHLCTLQCKSLFYHSSVCLSVCLSVYLYLQLMQILLPVSYFMTISGLCCCSDGNASQASPNPGCLLTMKKCSILLIKHSCQSFLRLYMYIVTNYNYAFKQVEQC